MINICFLSGKIVNKIDLKFVFDINKKRLGEKHISVVKVQLRLEDKQVINLHGYNEMADWIYRKVRQGEQVLIQGKLRNNYIEIEKIEKKSLQFF